MKKSTVSRIVLRAFLAAMIAVAATAWAANKGSLDLLHPTNVAGTKLPSGNYSVQWQGNGDQVEVKIYQGKKEVASTSGRVVQLDAPAEYSSAIVTTTDNGDSTLSQIRFAGKRTALEIHGAGGSGGAAGAAR